MSVKVFLKSEEVKKLEGFTTKKTFPNSSQIEGELPGNIKLECEKGRWSIHLHEPTDPVPAVVKNIIEEVSLYDSVPITSDRELGIYTHGSAEAEVDLDLYGKFRRLVIKIHAKNVEDVLKLYRMIRTGSVRPKESYDAPQGGETYAELEQEIVRLQQLLANKHQTIEGLHAKTDNLKDGLQQLSSELDKGGWPFCMKATVKQKLTAVMNEKQS